MPEKHILVVLVEIRKVFAPNPRISRESHFVQKWVTQKVRKYENHKNGSFKAIGRGVQGQKSDLILDESTFHCGSNAANPVTKFSTVLEICAVKVRVFFTLLGNLRSKIG